ncbi:MAG: type II toxin-antitoxin system HicB family antitoxin [Patescibacteria group bacterium]
MQKTLRYNIIFRPEPEGGFTVFVPSLPGCITYGTNLRNARRMAEDAIHGYLVSLKKHQEPIPQTDAEFLMSFIELQALDKTFAYA